MKNNDFETSVLKPLVTVTPFSLESIGKGIFALSSNLISSAAAAAWPVANQALFVPFMLTKQIIVVMMFTYNGAVNGNIDIGIYDEWGNRLVSMGGVAQAGANTLQTFDIADTLIGPGLFYMALSLDNAVGQVRRITLFANTAPAVLGMAEMAAAYPLPAIAVLATITGNCIPLFGLQTRVVI